MGDEGMYSVFLQSLGCLPPSSLTPPTSDPPRTRPLSVIVTGGAWGTRHLSSTFSMANLFCTLVTITFSVTTCFPGGPAAGAAWDGRGGWDGEGVGSQG